MIARLVIFLFCNYQIGKFHAMISSGFLLIYKRDFQIVRIHHSDR